MSRFISVVPDDENFVDTVIRPNFDITPTSCRVKTGSTIGEKELEDTMLFMMKAQAFTNWAIGDIGLEMDRRQMQDVTRRLCKIANKSYPRISANIRVCKRVPVELRDKRIDYSVYEEIFTSKKISDEQRVEFLTELRELEKIPSTKALRVQLAQFRNRNTAEGRKESYEYIHLKAFPRAPRNENGVVCLFGVLAESLGFRVTDLQAGFPDCKAQRLTQRGRGGAKNQYRDILIELEYRSSHFFDSHRHDYRKCQLIVCWENDVPNPPNDIEILSLKDAIKELAISKPALFEK